MVEESLSLKTINKKYKEHGSKTSCKEKSSAKNKTIHFKGSIKTIWKKVSLYVYSILGKGIYINENGDRFEG